MPRSVNHAASKARRKKVLNMAKGYFGRRKNVWTVAKNAVEKGLGYAYRDRKQKKRNIRSIWIVRINAAVREFDMSYSEFIGKLNAKNITLSRKALADLALNHPEAFKAIVNEVKDATPVSRPDNAPRVSNATNNAATTKPAAKAKATPKAATTVAAAKAPEATETETEKPAKKVKGDDLKKIEGIGPAIEKLLHAKEIDTFAKLAATSVEDIQAILDEAGSRYKIHNPSTWAQQSALAAEGKWDELKTWQDELNAGKETA